MAGTIQRVRRMDRRSGIVSMESGLDGRNNRLQLSQTISQTVRLNGVRPRWPEQFPRVPQSAAVLALVSMESGLDGRNNVRAHSSW